MKYCFECSKNGITKTATFGDINEGTPKYCSDCSKKIIVSGKIVNYKHGYCQKIINDNEILLSNKLCCENANFNYVDSKIKKGIRCINHKETDMICINGHLCIECKTKQASFILPDSNKKTPTHCSECLEKVSKDNIDGSNMKYDVIHKKCKECKIKSATFGLKGSKLKEYCSKCINKLNLDGIDLHHKKCIICNEHQAIFNFEGELPLYCGKHYEKDMIEIYSVKCEKCNLIKPSFNYEGEVKKRFCKNCSEEGMINVKDKLCINCNQKRPSFNYISEKNPMYCYNCKLPDMINVTYERCFEKNCNENAFYNFEDCKNALYCSEHYKEGMINIYKKKCLECSKTPIFGYENEEILYCKDHKLEGMIDIKHNKCIICNEHRARFNHYGEKFLLYCFYHKSELMINLEHKLCKTYLCGKRAIDKYEDYCMTCYVHEYPDKPVSRNYKTKESIVVQFILNKFSNFTWISDKTIIDSCSLKRPDLLLDLGYQVINIEIDENQHKSYEEICENKRLMMISKDIQHRNLILIRFNPDSYTSNNVKHLSCWNINKDGLCTLKKSYENEWKLRLKKLEETINYWINPENISDKMIHVIHLFFDE